MEVGVEGFLPSISWDFLQVEEMLILHICIFIHLESSFKSFQRESMIKLYIFQSSRGFFLKMISKEFL